MNKPLYKKVRVIHNPHRAEFVIEYKTWFIWNHDRKFMYYEQGKNPGFDKVFSKDEAQKLAIERAEELLEKHVIFEKSNFVYYV
jgi:hypothetical protein